MPVSEYTDVLVEIEPEGYVVECGKCSGSGTRPNSRHDCEPCGGTGTQTLAEPITWNCDTSLARCGKCGGTGMKPNTDRITCSVCDGAGALVRCFPRTECDACGGSGMQPNSDRLTCSTCEGVGSVWAESGDYGK
jgi:DnaJ-class molecular chaperone